MGSLLAYILHAICVQNIQNLLILQEFLNYLGRKYTKNIVKILFRGEMSFQVYL